MALRMQPELWYASDDEHAALIMEDKAPEQATSRSIRGHEDYQRKKTVGSPEGRPEAEASSTLSGGKKGSLCGKPVTGVDWAVARWWLPLTSQTSMGSLSLVMTALQVMLLSLCQLLHDMNLRKQQHIVHAGYAQQHHSRMQKSHIAGQCSL